MSGGKGKGKDAEIVPQRVGYYRSTSLESFCTTCVVDPMSSDKNKFNTDKIIWNLLLRIARRDNSEKTNQNIYK